MSNFVFLQALNYSVAIAAVIGLIRFRQIHRSYQPFIFILLTSLFIETIATLSTVLYKTNALVSNIYTIIECLFWFWQFKRWDGFLRRKALYFVLIGLLVSLWIFENLILKKILTFSSAFAIAYSFCLVFLAINQVN